MLSTFVTPLLNQFKMCVFQPQVYPFSCVCIAERAAIGAVKLWCGSLRDHYFLTVAKSAWGTYLGTNTPCRRSWDGRPLSVWKCIYFSLLE